MDVSDDSYYIYTEKNKGEQMEHRNKNNIEINLLIKLCLMLTIIIWLMLSVSFRVITVSYSIILDF
jgi:hypothetical protein